MPIKEEIAIAIARRLPRLVAYWCAMRLGVHATTGKYGEQETPNLLFIDALQRWQEPNDPVRPTVRQETLRNEYGSR